MDITCEICHRKLDAGKFVVGTIILPHLGTVVCGACEECFKEHASLRELIKYNNKLLDRMIDRLKKQNEETGRYIEELKNDTRELRNT